MSRTDLDPATLARSLRRMAGDGSVEWVCEPMQTRVLLDVADMLAENDKLREELESVGTAAYLYGRSDLKAENAKLRELITGAYEAMDAWQMVIANGSDTWGYGKGCLEQLRKLRDDMHELGIEVDG